MWLLWIMLFALEAQYNLRKTVPADNVNKVFIEVDGVDVYIQGYDSTFLKSNLVQKGCKVNLLKTCNFNVKKGKDAVYISIKKENMNPIPDSCAPKLIVYMPYVNTVKVNSRTGDVSIDGLKAKNITLNIQTGDAHVSHTKSESITASVNTGDIDMSKDVISPVISASTTTGDIILEKVPQMQNLRITTTVGDITLRANQIARKDKVTANTTTGDIKCSLKNIAKNVRICARTKNGEIRTSLHGILNRTADCNILLQTGNGDITISH